MSKKPMTRKKEAQLSLQRKMKRTFQDNERLLLEAQFAAAHAEDTDEELYAFMKEQKRIYKDRFKPLTTIGYLYYTQRLGPWCDVIGRINKELAEEKNFTAASHSSR